MTACGPKVLKTEEKKSSLPKFNWNINNLLQLEKADEEELKKAKIDRREVWLRLTFLNMYPVKRREKMVEYLRKIAPDVNSVSDDPVVLTAKFWLSHIDQTYNSGKILFSCLNDAMKKNYAPAFFVAGDNIKAYSSYQNYFLSDTEFKSGDDYFARAGTLDDAWGWLAVGDDLIDKDKKDQALKYFKKAAAEEFGVAAFKAYHHDYHGQKARENEYILMAYNQGNPDATWCLAISYENDKDYFKAARLMQQAYHLCTKVHETEQKKCVSKLQHLPNTLLWPRAMKPEDLFKLDYYCCSVNKEELMKLLQATSTLEYQQLFCDLVLQDLNSEIYFFAESYKTFIFEFLDANKNSDLPIINQLHYLVARWSLVHSDNKKDEAQALELIFSTKLEFLEEAEKENLQQLLRTHIAKDQKSLEGKEAALNTALKYAPRSEYLSAEDNFKIGTIIYENILASQTPIDEKNFQLMVGCFVRAVNKQTFLQKLNELLHKNKASPVTHRLNTHLIKAALDRRDVPSALRMIKDIEIKLLIPKEQYQLGLSISRQLSSSSGSCEIGEFTKMLDCLAFAARDSKDDQETQRNVTAFLETTYRDIFNKRHIELDKLDWPKMLTAQNLTGEKLLLAMHNDLRADKEPEKTLQEVQGAINGYLRELKQKKNLERTKIQGQIELIGRITQFLGDEKKVSSREEIFEIFQKLTPKNIEDFAGRGFEVDGKKDVDFLPMPLRASFNKGFAQRKVVTQGETESGQEMLRVQTPRK